MCNADNNIGNITYYAFNVLHFLTVTCMKMVVLWVGLCDGHPKHQWLQTEIADLLGVPTYSSLHKDPTEEAERKTTPF